MPETKVWHWLYTERYPQHIPDDNWDFQLHDVIAGPLEVNPKGSKHFMLPQYEEVVEVFRRVKDIVI